MSPMAGNYSLTCMAYTIDNDGIITVIESLNRLGLSKFNAVDILIAFTTKYQN